MKQLNLSHIRRRHYAVVDEPTDASRAAKKERVAVDRRMSAVLMEEFAEMCSGFCIGSNDLMKLTLGVDRDFELVASLFDERNFAVMWLIAAGRNGRPRHGSITSSGGPRSAHSRRHAAASANIFPRAVIHGFSSGH